MANNSDEVIITKGKADGYIFRAPKNTSFASLKSPDTPLPETFVGLGYINEDGIVEAFSTESEEKKDMNGTTVKVVRTSRSKTFAFSLMQTNEATLKVVYGDGNVSVEGGLREVKDNANGAVDSLYALWFVTDETDTEIEYTRVFIPNGAVSEIGEITWLGTDVKVYPITIAAQPDSTGNTAYMYTQRFSKLESDDATLSALSVGALDLTPAFDADVTTYTVATTNATNAVSATANDEGATVAITVNGSAHTSGEAATWEAGDNAVVVTVTAEDGTTTKAYTVTVTKS